MSTQLHSTTSIPGVATMPFLPPLETGDCLSRAEFERRYNAMPDIKKAELVEGVVYMGSPVGELHSDAQVMILTWLGVYMAHTSSVQAGDNRTVRFDTKNVVQPDAVLRLKQNGRSTIGPETYIEGPPELIAEIASSSVSRDLHAKLELYQRHGVREYLVWRVFDREVDWFRLVDDVYQLQAPDESGTLRSIEFPGLWLNRAALLKGDLAAVLSTLQQGLLSPEHGAFIGC